MCRCFFNTDATEEREDSGDSNQNQESPIPPAVEYITCDNNKEVLPQQLAFTLAHGVVKHEPIEQEDYWEEDCELEGVKKHEIYLFRFNIFLPQHSGLRRIFPRR